MDTGEFGLIAETNVWGQYLIGKKQKINQSNLCKYTQVLRSLPIQNTNSVSLCGLSDRKSNF